MITQSITKTEAQAVLDNACIYQAIPSENNYLSWTEKLEGAAWSVGFSLAGILAITVLAPIKLFTGTRAVEAVESSYSTSYPIRY